MVRTAVQGCIANNDQKFGRQLASILERQSMILRGHFGGSPLWAAVNKIVLGKPKRKE